MAQRTDCEHFIPIRKTDLIELLCREPALTGREREQFRQLCRLLQQQLDDAIEEHLDRAAGVRVDFEIDDALGKLKRLGLVEQSADGRYRAAAIEAALESLDRAWDSFFDYNKLTAEHRDSSLDAA